MDSGYSSCDEGYFASRRNSLCPPYCPCYGSALEMDRRVLDHFIDAAFRNFRAEITCKHFLYMCYNIPAVKRMAVDYCSSRRVNLNFYFDVARHMYAYVEIQTLKRSSDEEIIAGGKIRLLE